ncbi:hypothetical protein AAFF_G00010720 [Aldrovandia affinis]|uniref:Uncharacterized protein n=1 Tax=Aldrovandia affinis TaxID=143900 RepID=A0AAD7WHI3_9TELE|nr:hypothetical protein AAFF_G00010720 [Aldrovandia affinis]
MESRGNFEGLIAQLIASNQAQQVRHEQQMEGQRVRHDQLMAEQQQHTAVMRAELQQLITAQEAQAAANLVRRADPGHFGMAQLEDPNLTSALQQVSVVDGRLMDEGQKKSSRRGTNGEQLDPTQRQDMLELVGRNRDVFLEEPGHTELAQHSIVTEPGKKVKQRPYRIPEARREAVRTEAPGLKFLGHQPEVSGPGLKSPWLECTVFPLHLSSK